MRLIDAEPLLDMLEREENENEDIPNRSDGIRDAIIDILNAPTIEAVPVVHGRWVPVGVPYEDYECDQCGYICEFAQRNFSMFNYCPNCGSRMVVNND